MFKLQSGEIRISSVDSDGTRYRCDSSFRLYYTLDEICDECEFSVQCILWDWDLASKNDRIGILFPNWKEITFNQIFISNKKKVSNADVYYFDMLFSNEFWSWQLDQDNTGDGKWESSELFSKIEVVRTNLQTGETDSWDKNSRKIEFGPIALVRS